MPFKYHPRTRTKCRICEELCLKEGNLPVIDSHKGKASSANNFPFHNWYNFILGYSPEFPRFILARESVTPADLVVDPFMGSGTTLACCKLLGIPSKGIDANDFMVDAARTKLCWDTDVKRLRGLCSEILRAVENEYGKYKWDRRAKISGGDLEKLNYLAYGRKHRPAMLLPKYLSDKPFVRASIINEVIQGMLAADPLKHYFDLALASIIVPISNVSYGPGFGVGIPKEDVDVLGLFSNKLRKIVQDLEGVCDQRRKVSADVVLGDARRLSEYLEFDSVALMITSPPYPADHEYTKNTRLELIFRGHARNLEEFRAIKKRMLRASTTNLYKGDNSALSIADIQSIRAITDLIQKRLRYDGATSGFEKQYTRLVWEYFGGMHQVLTEAMKVLKPGGRIALLVSDSHAFKMVHIQTARILQEIAEKIGFVNPEVILWQFKASTSHKYSLRENVLILSKP
jgi:DNA modification methylase